MCLPTFLDGPDRTHHGRAGEPPSWQRLSPERPCQAFKLATLAPADAAGTGCRCPGHLQSPQQETEALINDRKDTLLKRAGGHTLLRRSTATWSERRVRSRTKGNGVVFPSFIAFSKQTVRMDLQGSIQYISRGYGHTGCGRIQFLEQNIHAAFQRQAAINRISFEPLNCVID